MLTLNAEEFLSNNSITNNEDELRIALVDLSRTDEIKRALESQGYSDIVPEDDEGNLYLTACRKKDQNDKPEEKVIEPVKPVVKQEQIIKPAANIHVIKNSTGVLISCEAGKYKQSFYKKILISLVNSRIKPNVLALMNGSVRLAAYNSQSCAYIKQLETDGVKVLISKSCADSMGITEAIGAGFIVDMSEIFDEIFLCEKVVSL